MAGRRDDPEVTLLCDPPSLLGGQGAGQPNAQLIVVEGATPGQKVVFDGPLLRIGRRPDSDLVLESHAVSRDHAVVVREEDCYYLIDIGSYNGVYVNGKKILPQQRHRLTHGDSLTLGNVLLLFLHHKRFVNTEGGSCIHIDRERVQTEVDSFFARFLPTTDPSVPR